MPEEAPSSVMIYEIKGQHLTDPGQENYRSLLSPDGEYFYWNRKKFVNLQIGAAVFVVNKTGAQVLHTELDAKEIPVEYQSADNITTFNDLGQTYSVGGEWDPFVRLKIIQAVTTPPNWTWKTLGSSENTYLLGEHVSENSAANNIVRATQLRNLPNLNESGRELISYCISELQRLAPEIPESQKESSPTSASAAQAASEASDGLQKHGDEQNDTEQKEKELSQSPWSEVAELFVEEAKTRSKLQFSVSLVQRLLASLSSKNFAILTGLSGSGKTKLAQALAQWITPMGLGADPFYPGAAIKSERIEYYVSKSDRVAVEFWNSDNPDEATKVCLPRELIQEWADHIRDHDILRETGAREIREAVKAASRFSDQLHSFETHLKAAAFALIDSDKAGTQSKCYEVIPVGADWMGNENIVGYPNGLDADSYISTPALELILRCRDHPDVPHFLILDEMNLSHVERYFADFLSGIESGEEIPLYQGTERKAGATIIPNKLSLPQNLFVIGTVNVDETTYLFSPKVLDRANVIEFRMDQGDLEKFLSNHAKPDLSRLAGEGAGFGMSFVHEATDAAKQVPTDVRPKFDEEMRRFFIALAEEGAEFGYRTAYEAGRFIYFYNELRKKHKGEKDGQWFDNAFDAIIVQKFLPKLHGSSSKLSGLLHELLDLCQSVQTDDSQASMPPRFPMSAAKIERMIKVLERNGFVSFAEA